MKSNAAKTFSTQTPSTGRTNAASFTLAIQSRIDDLFWPEAKSQGDIKTILKQEWPEQPEKKLFELIRSTILTQTTQGKPAGNGNRYFFTKSGLFMLSGSGDKLKQTTLTNFEGPP